MIFNYIAKDKSGQRMEGSIEANDRLTALRQVEKKGLIPVSITTGNAPAKTKESKSNTPATKLSFSFNKTPRMKPREILIFSTELSDLLASGMNLGLR